MEENNLFILDASVLIKWFTGEAEDLEDAIYIRERWEKSLIEIIVPAHCFTEVINTIGRKYQNIADVTLSELLNSGIITHLPNLDTGTMAINLMKKYEKVSFYDAIYHTLAISKKGIFITADERYYNTVKKEGSITLLRDISRIL